MLKPNQKVFATWNGRNKKYYEEKGYVFTTFGDKFEVKVEDLSKGSHAEVVVLCDYCGKESIKKYQTYLRQHDEILGDCCVEHQYIKAKSTWKNKYGVENVFQSEEIKKKIKQSCLEKYGTEYACQSQEVKDKIEDTCLEKYGATTYAHSEQGKKKIAETNLEKFGAVNPFSNKEVRQRSISTMKEKYGVEHALQLEQFLKKSQETCMSHYGVKNCCQNDEVRKRIVETNLRKYGKECTLQVPEVRRKGMMTLYKNGKVPTSKPQLKVYEMLKEKYENCYLNYPCCNYFLDCFVEENGVKIDVEYDGKFWHENKKEKDAKRDADVKSEGYKVFRILGGVEIPTKEQLYTCIEELINTDKEYSKINLV